MIKDQCKMVNEKLAFQNGLNINEITESLKFLFSVIPAEAGIQLLLRVRSSLDSGFHRSDDFLRVYQCLLGIQC